METPESPRLTTAQRYFLAGLAAVVALLLRGMLAPWLGTNAPYFTVLAALVFSSLYCGVGPSVVATIGSFFGAWYLFLPYTRSFRLQDPKNEIAGMVRFAAFSAFIIVLGE